MVTPSDIAVLVASGTHLSSTLILSLTMFRLMCCESRRYFGSAARENVAHRYKTDKNLCSTNWAMVTSLCSTLTFTTYGTYFMYEYLNLDDDAHQNHHKLLTGHIPFIPNVMAVTFRSIAILLVLSHSLWKLNQKYTENDESPVEYYTIVCLCFLICVSAIFSFSGILTDHVHIFKDKSYWYYYTNIAGYGLETFIIFWIGKLFYQRLQECDLEAINEAEIKEISKSETRSHQSVPIPVISESGESKIDHLSKQVLLSWMQTFFMTIGCTIQASMYVYYYFTPNENHYFAFPIQCISFCFVIILMNWCIWLSLEYTHKWYKYLCCCHSYVRNSIRKDVKMGKAATTPSINTTINQATIISYDYSGGQLQHEPMKKTDLKVNAAYRDHKRQAYQSIGSAPETHGNFNNTIAISAENDNQSLISDVSGISIDNFSNTNYN